MKKKLFIFFLLVTCCQVSFSQNVGIGTTTPNSSAMLDLTSTSKGLLVPRMTTGSVVAISNPARGLLVYDSSVNLLLANKGTGENPAWQPVDNNNGWNITGNSGTQALHFIGTTDNKPLRFRINNVQSGIIDSSGRTTLLGYSSGSSITTGAANTGFGYRALYSNTAGNSNTAAGAYSLQANTSGNNNSAVGYESLFSNSTGDNNTAVGITALRLNTTGNNNTATGTESLYSNSSGSENSAYGFKVLYSNTIGTNNTAFGNYSLFANISGSYNTAVGIASLNWNSNGVGNSSLGYWTLFNNLSGSYNTAAGMFALSSNTVGVQNTAFANNALLRNVNGNYSTAMGYSALKECINGWGNTGIGHEAMINTLSSSYNTAIGYRAGFNANNGWNNTFIGSDANANFNGLFNTIAIGNGALTTASNQVRIGNSSNNSIGGHANWTNLSDGRFKKNIQENVRGLDFIMKLRPVTYNLDVTSLSKSLHEPENKTWNDDMKNASAEKEQVLQTGFVAQEVEAAAKQLGYDFSGVDKPKNENDFYGLRYAEFVVPLVKAMQEQQHIIESLAKKIENLEAELNTVKVKR